MIFIVVFFDENTTMFLRLLSNQLYDKGVHLYLRSLIMMMMMMMMEHDKHPLHVDPYFVYYVFMLSAFHCALVFNRAFRS
jgi:hypothetical protein